MECMENAQHATRKEKKMYVVSKFLCQSNLLKYICLL